MPLTSITIENYRSVRGLTLPVERLSLFIGANGVGKTNLYKALALLQCAAHGTLTRAIAEEGGIESVLWAGPRRPGKPVRLVLKAHFDEMTYGVEVGLPHSYEIEIGLRQPAEAAFTTEPLGEEERLIVRHGRREEYVKSLGARPRAVLSLYQVVAKSKKVPELGKSVRKALEAGMKAP